MARYKISSFVVLLALSTTTYAQSAFELSTEQKVGQLFIWTIGGKSLGPHTASWLKKYQPGAIIAFSRNIKNPAQVAKFNSDLQALAAKNSMTPFFLMIDQEGGVVTRVRSSTPLPSALAVGKLEDADLARRFGKAKAEFLLQMGFNVNLAPVLDLSNPDKDSFIGNRAFGHNPEQVSSVAISYAEGLAEGGVMPTAKHFPGHGGVSQDSHYSMARKLATYEELSVRDLKPFANYSNTGFVKALMTAHLALPNVDPSGLPATYSPVLIKEYLRGKIGYDGLIFTDDLEMSGAAGLDIGERAVTAFLAGNDMLMLAGSPNHQRKAFHAMLSAVRSGRISEARLNESVQRILAAKNQVAAKPFGFHRLKTESAGLALTRLSNEILRKNFEQAASGPPPFVSPFSGPKDRVLVLSADYRFYSAFKKKFAGPTQFFRLSPATLKDAKAKISQSQFKWALFYASGSTTARWLNSLDADLRRKTVVINANHAGEVSSPDSFLSLLNINSSSPQSGGWMAERLRSTPLRLPAEFP